MPKDNLFSFEDDDETTDRKIKEIASGTRGRKKGNSSPSLFKGGVSYKKPNSINENASTSEIINRQFDIIGQIFTWCVNHLPMIEKLMGEYTELERAKKSKLGD